LMGWISWMWLCHLRPKVWEVLNFDFFSLENNLKIFQQCQGHVHAWWSYKIMFTLGLAK
jgi:hypothetical protein